MLRVSGTSVLKYVPFCLYPYPYRDCAAVLYWSFEAIPDPAKRCFLLCIRKAVQETVAAMRSMHKWCT